MGRTCLGTEGAEVLIFQAFDQGRAGKDPRAFVFSGALLCLARKARREKICPLQAHAEDFSLAMPLKALVCLVPFPFPLNRMLKRLWPVRFYLPCPDSPLFLFFDPLAYNGRGL